MTGNSARCNAAAREGEWRTERAARGRGNVGDSNGRSRAYKHVEWQTARISWVRRGRARVPRTRGRPRGRARRRTPGPVAGRSVRDAESARSAADPAGHRLVNVCRHVGSRESPGTARRTERDANGGVTRVHCGRDSTHLCCTRVIRRRCPRYRRRKRPWDP